MAVFPLSWKIDEVTIVPEEEANWTLLRIHESLGHDGQKRMEAWLNGQKINITNWKPRFREIKMAFEACANKGGTKPPNYIEAPIAREQKGEHFFSRCRLS